MNVISTGEPTYWPTDPNKLPDLIDFRFTKGISSHYIKCESCLELSSDHFPALITLSRLIAATEKPLRLQNRKTNWTCFREIVRTTLDLNISLTDLKTEDNITEAVEQFNNCPKRGMEINTSHPGLCPTVSDCSPTIGEKIAGKRKLRKQWQQNRCPVTKRRFNHATREFKILLQNARNYGLQTYLTNLNASAETNYSLWKATKKLKHSLTTCPPIRKHDNSWARSNTEKTEAFIKHLSTVFTPNPNKCLPVDELNIGEVLNQTNQLDSPTKKVTKHEVMAAIKNLISNKAPGYDLITVSCLSRYNVNLGMVQGFGSS